MKYRMIAKDISKRYGKKTIIKDISLDASSGECIGIIGRNGCGKTTFISILAGVEKPDEGRIAILDEMGNLIKRDAGTIGYVPQVNPLMEDLSVKDNLWLWCENKDAFSYIVDRYDFGDILKKRVKTLSGGMKRRLVIACALANKPPVLIMDEPTTSLDIEYKAIIHDEMRRYLDDGGLIILVTHEKEEIDFCDKCYIIEESSIRQYEGGQSERVQ